MKSSKRIWLLVLLGCTVIFSIPGLLWVHNAAAAGAIRYYISPSGNDQTGDGSLKKPFRTLEHTRDVVRGNIANGMSADIRVFLRGGTYPITSTLSFDERDSGRNGFNIIYSNYNNEQALLTGSSTVGDWQVYQGQIYKTHVGNNRQFNVLYENDQRGVKARYPNTGYSRVDKMFGAEWSPESRSKFGYKDGDLPALTSTDGLQVYIWPGGANGEWNWYTNTINVSSVDTANHVINLNSQTSYSLGAGSRYFVQNSLELLDQPGEFYLDRKAGDLYYWPRDAKNLTGKVSAPNVDVLLSLKGSTASNTVQNIQFVGLTLKNTDSFDELAPEHPGREGEALITLESAQRILLKNNHIYNSGLNGIIVKNRAEDNQITGNLLYDVGIGGISVSGGPISRANLSSGTAITNNHIHHTGIQAGHGGGIDLNQTGNNKVAHNLIHDTPRFAISLGSPERPGLLLGKTIEDTVITEQNVGEFLHTKNNTIEDNDVSHANTDSQDTGVIYAWGIGSQSGNAIRNNLIHDSELPFSYGYGIYLDDACGGFTIANNIIFNLQKRNTTGILNAAIQLKGIGNVISNNIIVDNNAVAALESWEGFGEPTTRATIERNIFSNNNDIYRHNAWQNERLASSNYNLLYNPQNQYKVEGIPFVHTLEDFKNLFTGQFEKQSLTANPAFVNPSQQDYRLKYNSPAYSLGFQDINVGNIGLTRDYPFTTRGANINKLFVETAKTHSGQASLNLQEREQAQLTLSARTSNGNLETVDKRDARYASSNTRVASVNAWGEVKAHASGISTITITTQRNGKTVRTTLDIIVADTVKTLSLQTATTYLAVGAQQDIRVIGTTRLGRTVDLTGQAQFSSSNTAVLTVERTGTQARLKAISAGSSQISARYKNIATSLQLQVTDKTLKDIGLTTEHVLLGINKPAALQVNATLSDNSTVAISQEQVKYAVADTSIATVSQDSTGKNVVTGLKSGQTSLFADIRYQDITVRKTITLYVYESTENNLPTPWQVKNFSANGHDTEGFARYDDTDKSVTMISNGYDIWNNADNFTFAYQQRSTKNDYVTSISATIDKVSFSHPSAAAGILMRDSDSADSKNAMLRVGPEGGLLLTYRTQQGGSSSYSFIAKVTFPVELKLEREGNTFTGYYKQNGQWLKGATVNVEMGADMFVGAGLYSREYGVPINALYKDLQINEVYRPVVRVTDTLTDWSHVSAHSEGWDFSDYADTWNEQDHSLLHKHDGATDALFFTYNFDNMRNFSLKFYYHGSFVSDPQQNIKISVSSDNTNWQTLPTIFSSGGATGGGWNAGLLTSSDDLPAGTKYLKVEMVNVDPAWSMQLSQLELTYTPAA